MADTKTLCLLLAVVLSVDALVLMKLLFFIYSLRSGGAERVTVNLANHWSTMGWQVTILTMLPPTSDFYELHQGVRRIYIDLASEGGNVLLGLFNNIRRIWALRRILKRDKPDIALSMMTTANVLLGFAAYGITDLATIGSERVYPPSVVTSRSLWGRLRRWTYGRLTAIAAQTGDSKCWLESNTLARTVAAIPNPVEWPLPIHGSALQPNLLVGDGMRLLLAAGRLEYQKGFDWLIDVFATLSKKHQNWILVILGDGPQRKALEKQIENRQMRMKVILAGVVGNMAEWYSTADLYVLSSRFEGFPNTLVEALSYGLPVISFDCDSGPRDIIRNGIDGLLVPVGDVNGLTSALDKMMSNETIRHNFAERAREVRERFSINRVAEMWEALFKAARSDG